MPTDILTVSPEAALTFLFMGILFLRSMLA